MTGFPELVHFSCMGRDVVVSYNAIDFMSVFDIPGSHEMKIDHKKISKEVKLFFIRLVC